MSNTFIDYLWESWGSPKTETHHDISFTRVKNDVNGNPRHVVHFSALNTPEESNDHSMSVHKSYGLALDRAKKIGGKKFSNRQYGGGIVFQSYSPKDTAKKIHELRGTSV